jgi:hypothetical protein
METIEKTPLIEKSKPLKILGVGFGLAIVIGGTIGVGILRNTRYCRRQSRKCQADYCRLDFRRRRSARDY